MFSTQIGVPTRMPKIFCLHKSEDRITQDHEIFCHACGSCLGTVTEIESASSESTVNLFQQFQVGSEQVDLTSIGLVSEAGKQIESRKLFAQATAEKKGTLSQFSNACHKLQLPQNVVLGAWNLFTKLEKGKKTSIILGKTPPSKRVAAYAIYEKVREFGVPVSKNEIILATDTAFSSKKSSKESNDRAKKPKDKKLPTMLKIIFDVGPFAKELGLRDEIKGDELYYHIELNLRQFQNSLKNFSGNFAHKPNWFQTIMKKVEELPDSMTAEAKARRAVLAYLKNDFGIDVTKNEIKMEVVC